MNNRGEAEFLSDVALVVDGFHFTGHKAEDLVCQLHCNPHAYPVLRRPDGTWLFNTSAAEQVNSWFGRFNSKVKEMNVVRSGILLDSLGLVRAD